jgi:hypothetical protein
LLFWSVCPLPARTRTLQRTHVAARSQWEGQELARICTEHITGKPVKPHVPDYGTAFARLVWSLVAPARQSVVVVKADRLLDVVERLQDSVLNVTYHVEVPRLMLTLTHNANRSALLAGQLATLFACLDERARSVYTALLPQVDHNHDGVLEWPEFRR